MTRGRKTALVVIIVIVGAVVLAAIIVPMLLDVDRFRPEVVAQIRAETGKPAQIGHLALALFPTLAVRADEVSLGNPAGFPEGTFLRVKSVRAEPDARALWNREILIKSLVLSAPVLNLLSDVRGRWNFENQPAAESHPKTGAAGGASREQKQAFTLGVISNVSIEGAQLSAANLLPSGRPGPAFFAARDVSSQLQQVDLSALTGSPSAAQAHLRGQSTQVAGPWSSVAHAAPPDPRPAAEGRLRAGSLSFGKLQATDFKASLRLFPKQVYFDNVSFDLYTGHAAGELAVDLAGANPHYSAHVQMTGVDVGQLLAAFPEARGKMTGKMDGNIKLSGEATHSPDPLAGMRGVGEVAIRNGQLPSLQLNKNLMLLARATELGSASGDPSSFSLISADLTIANGRITSNKVRVVGNGVDIDGSGSVSLAGAGSLDFQGLAQIAAGQTPITNVLQNITGATTEGGKLSFPFSIAGTLSNPKFLLKAVGGAGRLGALGNLPIGKTGQPTVSSPSQNPQKPADLVEGIAGLIKKRRESQQKQPPQQRK